MTIDLEAGTALTMGGMLIAIIAWLFRMEAGVREGKEKSKDIVSDIEKVDSRIEKLEIRHDAVNNEVRAMLLGIQKSISNVEGRLGVHSNTRE